MLHASTQKLIAKLCELTEAGHIAWKHGEGRTCTFETEGYLVEVQGQPPRLRLLHTDGRELERADEVDLASQPSPGGDGGTFATQITLLAARADRIARGAEHAISRILSSLSAPPKSAPFEFPPGAASADPPPPPAPHTMPGPPPDPIPADTAIDRVLAVDPAPPPTIEPPAAQPEPEPVIIESEATAIVGDPEAVKEAIEEARAETTEPPAEAPAPETPAAEPEPVVIEAEPVLLEAETVAIIAEPVTAEPPPPPEPPPVPEPAQRPIVRPWPQHTFGATHSFARPRDPSAAPAMPRAASPKPFSTSPLFFGVNQISREPARAEPEPPPVPPPTAKPVQPASPAAEKKPQPAAAGPDIYKPWS